MKTNYDFLNQSQATTDERCKRTKKFIRNSPKILIVSLPVSWNPRICLADIWVVEFYLKFESEFFWYWTEVGLEGRKTHVEESIFKINSIRKSPSHPLSQMFACPLNPPLLKSGFSRDFAPNKGNIDLWMNELYPDGGSRRGSKKCRICHVFFSLAFKAQQSKK